MSLFAITAPSVPDDLCPVTHCITMLHPPYSNLDELTYHNIADETMDSLAEYFEDIGDTLSQSHQEYDVHFGVSELQPWRGGGGGGAPYSIIESWQCLSYMFLEFKIAILYIFGWSLN